jgi:diadenosine tetraphosphate (Ap4A) HIT family hydrolase
MRSECVFCAKLAQRAPTPADLVWEFPHSVAYLGHWQFYHGYCVLVSRRHARELSELEEEPRMAFLREMCLLARALETVFRPRKLNYELLGNQVPHLHWHLFPRYEDDPENLKPVWVRLDRAEGDDQARARLRAIPAGKGDRVQTVAQIRQQLSTLVGPSP